MKKIPLVGDVVIILAGAPHVEDSTKDLIGDLGVVERIRTVSEGGYGFEDNVYLATADGPLYYYPRQMRVLGQL